MTNAEIGAEVMDKDGNSLGKIDYIVRDTWSGDIKKYIVYRQPPDKDLSFTPEEISEIKENGVIVDLPLQS